MVTLPYIEIDAPDSYRLSIGRALKKLNLKPAEYILIAPRRKIVSRYNGDENVRERFIYEHCIAMCRNEADEGEIFVAWDMHDSDYPITEIIISVLHELYHIKGVESERNAEQKARAEYHRVFGDTLI